MHWKIVISYIELALLNWPNDARILRTVTCVFLKYSMNIPDWLEILYKVVLLIKIKKGKLKILNVQIFFLFVI